MTDVYALIYASGRAETLIGGPQKAPLSDYWAVLDHLATRHNSSEFSSDYPRKLLRNGELILTDPTTEAWRYQHETIQARLAAANKVKEKHWPEWMEKKP